MPLYEYTCRACGHEFEALVRGSSMPSCPVCQAVDLQRLVSLFAVDTEGTRQTALAHGRRLAAGERRERAVAEREEIEHHH